MQEEEKLEKNPYEALLVQNLEELVLDISMNQMEQRSILSNEVKYVQHNQHSIRHYTLEAKALEDWYGTKMYKRLQEEERDAKEIDFNLEPERLRQNYMDVLEGVKLEIMYMAKYDKDCDIGTMCMGTSNIRRQDDLKAEHKLPITGVCCMDGKL